jgi:hypothetical protein
LLKAYARFQRIYQTPPGGVTLRSKTQTLTSRPGILAILEERLWKFAQAQLSFGEFLHHD